MPRLTFAVPCLQVIHDRNTNLMNYINCVEQLTVDSFPTDFIEITVGTNWYKDSAKSEIIKIKMEVHSPSGQKVADKPIEDREFSEKHTRLRLNIRVPAFHVNEEGHYEIKLYQKSGRSWKEISSLPILVSLNNGSDAKENID